MLITVLCVTFLLMGAVVSFGQIDETIEGKTNEARITIRKGQLLQWTIDRPDKTTGFVIVNPTDQFGSVDFGALDGEGNEVSRSSTEIEPYSRRRYAMPLEMFEGEQFDEVFTIDEVASVWI